jgi:hypothetical protein
MVRFGSIKIPCLAVSAAALLSACGGGEGTPPPEGGAGTAGSGGSGGSGGGGSAECPNATPVPGGTIAPLEVDGARLDGTSYGGWFFFHAGPADGCDTCKTTPSPGEPPDVVLEVTDPPRAGSTKAMHWFGTDFIPGTYGAGMGIYFDNCANAAPDVTGIKFFYRSESAVKFASTQLMVDHGVDLPAAADWTERSVQFSEFAPPGFDQTAITGIFWRVPGPTNGTFSMWLDDVQWIGGTAP